MRVHAGASDLAPLRTLIVVVRLLGQDASRLAEAQREVEAAPARPRIDAGRIPTPV